MILCKKTIYVKRFFLPKLLRLQISSYSEVEKTIDTIQWVWKWTLEANISCKCIAEMIHGKGETCVLFYVSTLFILYNHIIKFYCVSWFSYQIASGFSILHSYYQTHKSPSQLVLDSFAMTLPRTPFLVT